MRSRYLIVLTFTLAATGADASDLVAQCMRASGRAAARCLERQSDVVAGCRSRRDADCEASAHAPGGKLDAALDRIDEPDRAACTAGASEALDYIDVDDVVLRGQNACADFSSDWLDAAVVDPSSSAAGAFLECQRAAIRQLGRLREATVRAQGDDCFLQALRGAGCNKARRDRRLGALRAGIRSRIVRRCGDRFDELGLGSLDDVLARVGGHARHFAQLVYPPNDLGPTAARGPYPVGVRTLALTDPTRLDAAGTGPRPVLTEVYYPSTDAAVAGTPRDVISILGVPVVRTPSYRDVALASGRFPLVVFSHGNGGIRFQSFFFASHLASHGYIVVTPDHHGNTFVDALTGVVDPNVAANRPLDLSFLLDRFTAFDAEPGNFFAGAVDTDRIGASGHSFGGYTVFALAGGPSPFGTFTDRRVRAILPQAPGSPFAPSFFATITIPTLILGGSIDETTPFDSQQRMPWDALPTGAPVVALAQLADAGHFTFSDYCEVDRELLGFLGGFDEACEPRHIPWRRAHDIVNYLSLNFFDAILKGDADALARLDPAVIAGIEDLQYWRK